MAKTSTTGTLGASRVTLEFAFATDETGGEPLLVCLCGGGGGGGGERGGHDAAVRGRR